MTIPCRILMIYPKFVSNSFWNYTEACELVGAKYPAAPLVLPGTQLTRRLAKEGRLHEGHDLMRAEQAGDQCSLGCNFDTKRPHREILVDYKTVLGHVFSPSAYAGRLSQLAVMLDRSDRRRDLPDGDMRKKLGGIDSVHHIMRTLPEVREPFWKTFVEVAKTNPGALRYIVMLMALSLHLGPFSKRVIAEIDRRIAELDVVPPMRPPANQALTPAAVQP